MCYCVTEVALAAQVLHCVYTNCSEGFQAAALHLSTGKTTLIKALTGEATMQLCDHLFTTLDVMAHMGLLPLCMPIMYMALCHSCHTV